ncbi:antiporter [Vibrio cholerae]|nr:antiporter [Vibrio cholerae]EGR4176626.1 antiporter [Vibrio cholerae]PAR82617.1 antiporter [Vibrio cholerae]
MLPTSLQPLVTLALTDCALSHFCCGFEAKFDIVHNFTTLPL